MTDLCAVYQSHTGILSSASLCAYTQRAAQPVPVYGLLGARASSPLLKQAGRLRSQGTGSAFTKQTSSSTPIHILCQGNQPGSPVHHQPLSMLISVEKRQVMDSEGMYDFPLLPLRHDASCPVSFQEQTFHFERCPCEARRKAYWPAWRPLLPCSTCSSCPGIRTTSSGPWLHAYPEAALSGPLGAELIGGVPLCNG
jgi:hypothetical protein